MSNPPAAVGDHVRFNYGAGGEVVQGTVLSLTRKGEAIVRVTRLTEKDRKEKPEFCQLPLPELRVEQTWNSKVKSPTTSKESAT